MEENANNQAVKLDENQNVQAVAGSPTGDEAAANHAPPAKKKKKGKKTKWIIIGAVLLAVVFAVWRLASSTQTPGTAESYSLGKAEKRDITVSLSGSGTLEPADSYIVTTLIEGEILEDTFEEGDMVSEDDLLYQVDNSAAAKNIERAEMSLSQTEKSYTRLLESLDDLNVKAAEAGTVVELKVEVGDDVSAGQQIGTLRNSSVMSLELPFAADDAASLSVGMKALVTIDGSFETIQGTISKVSAVDEIAAGNMIVRRVTIDVKNPGGITAGQAATAMAGNIACSESGVFAYKGEAVITARAAGEVTRIVVEEGGFVNENGVILALKSDTLSDQVSKASDSIKDSKLTLEDRYDLLDDYTINSPISGTIIEKNYKQGDMLSAGKTLCTIYDLSYLKMTLNVDELDISKVKVGQKVTITADAMEGKTFEGEVTKVNIKGNTVNGVSSYPVSVRVDKTDGLLPGMNVDANIVVEGVSDVLAVPISAVTRGNKVLVQTDPAADGSVKDAEGVPVGFKYVDVETGMSDDEYIEIKSGLEEGQTVALIRVFNNNNLVMMPNGGMVAVTDTGAQPAGGPQGNRPYNSETTTRTAGGGMG